MDDAAMAGQNLPFGAPEDENGVTQGMDADMQAVPPVPEEDGTMASMGAESQIPIGDIGMESFDEEPLSAGGMTESGELPPLEDMDGGGLSPMENMESGNQVLPFGNVEDGVGSIETGENAGISGLKHTAESGDLELSGESDGIGSYQDGMENISGTGGMGHMDGAGTVPGTGAVGTEPSGRMNGLETSGSGHALPMGEGAGVVTGGTAEHSGAAASIAGKTITGAGASPAMSGIQRQGGVSEGLRGCYQAERDGKQYMRYDAGLYEKPKGPYQTIHENGKIYYELPKKENAPAMLPETKAVLEKDGTLRLERCTSRRNLWRNQRSSSRYRNARRNSRAGRRTERNQ